MRVEREARAGRDGPRANGTGARRGPVGLGLFAWVSLLPLFAACGSDDAPPTASEPLPEGVDTAVRGMRTFVTRDGIRRAVVEADTAEWREENEIHLRRMTLTFFDPNGLESTEVTAEFGIFHQLTGDLEAERRVVVEDRVDDQRLETERLRYRNVDGRLLGDTAFQLLRGVEGLTLEGTGFESDPALDSVVVLNQAGEMRPGVAYSEAVPLPAVPAGDTTEAGPAPAAGEPAPAAGERAPADAMAAGVDPAEVDPAAIPAQDSSAVADTTAPDSTTAALPDSLEAPPDTTTADLPDSLEAPPDSTTAALPDSMEAPPDTRAAARR